MERKQSFIPPAIDVIGKRICWKPENGSTVLYGTIIKTYFKSVKPENLLYDSQRILKKKLVVELNDGRVLTLSGELEDMKRLKVREQSRGFDEEI